MKKFHSVFGVLIFVLIIGGESESETKYYIDENGFGPVKIGMTVNQASNALGRNLTPAGTLEEEEIYCHYVYSENGYDHTAFMVEEGIITRIDIQSSDYSTDRGITVGSTEKEIHTVYGDTVKEKIHPYLGHEGKYLIINTKTGFQIIFETYQGEVSSFRTGRLPSVSYIEGCL